MIVLGIETSTAVCSAALVMDTTLLGEYRLNIKNIHASRLLPIIQSLLDDCKLSIKNIDGIAISIGPGSFTGLRIGLAVAKGLAISHNKKLVAIPSLEAYILFAPIKEGLICPVVSARSGEYYIAKYQRLNYIDELTEDIRIVPQDHLIDHIPSKGFVLSNDFQLENYDLIKRRCNLFPECFRLPSAFSVALLGQKKLRNNEYDNIDFLEPAYYQNFVAGKPKPII